MEVALDEEGTPIKQDTKKGKLRDYPYNINWNYGLVPQTWEDPEHTNEEAGGAGDNDPVDVVEIGTTALEMGGVYTVKPIGIYAMIDEGELDWKLIAINSEVFEINQQHSRNRLEKKSATLEFAYIHPPPLFPFKS